MEIFTSFCNMCYKENVDLNDICSTAGNMMLMKNIIEACFHNIDLQRHVPLYLCTDCCNKIIEMSRFQEICVKNLICLKKNCLRKKELLEKEHVNEEYIQSVLKNIIKGRKNYTLKYLHEISTVDTLCKNVGRTSLTLNEDSLSQTDMESDDASVISTIPSSAIRTPSPNRVTEIVHRLEEQIRKSQEVKDEIKEENIESEDLQADENDMHVFVGNGLTTTITSEPRIAGSPKDENEIVNSLMEDLPTYRREIQNKIKEENDKDSLCVQMDEDDMDVFIDDDMDISVDDDDKEVESIILSKERMEGVDKNDGCLYKCKYCAKLFAVKNLYISHLKRIHQRVESVQVDGKTGCSSDESRTESLPASPSSERRRQHICRLCNKHFRTPSDLTRHMRVHNGERPFQCNICQKRFTQRSSLNRHAKIHAGNKPHVCSVCDKAFAVKADIIRHTRTHTGRRPYKCTECPKAFIEQSTLVKHIRIHTGVKPYVCPECNAAFTDSGHLTTHIRTHTGEKPYQCAICCSSFTRADNLTKHKRIHNKN